MSVKDCIVEVQSAVKDLFNDKEAADIVNKIKNKIDEKKIAKEIDLSEERIVKEIADEQKKINLIKKLNALKARQIAFERFADNIENFPNKPLDGLKAMLGGITASNKGSRLSVDNYQLLFKNKYQGGFEEEMTSADLTDLAKSKEMELPIIQETMDNPFLRLSDVEKKKDERNW